MPKILPLFIALLAVLTFPVTGQPVITEFLASNSTILADEDGEFSDWIEIHNPTSSALDLTGWHLTDDAAAPAKWTFPERSLAPGEYLVVFASSKNRTEPAGQLHTNFKLSAGGEYLGLIAPDGVTVATEFAPTYPPQATDVSYGTSTPSEWITLFGPTSPARVHVPNNGGLGDSWRAIGFNDSGWIQGNLGVGFDTKPFPVDLNPYIGTDVRSQMFGTRTSVLVRVPFIVPNPSEVLALELNTIFEDGFTAHLNGGPQRVSEGNAPTTLAWNSSATVTIFDSDPLPDITTDLTSSIPALVAGENILAYQGLNINATSSDLLVTGTLRALVPNPLETGRRGYFASPTPGAVNGGNDSLSLSESVTFSEPSRTFQNSLEISFSGATPDQTIRYTLNGSLPTESSFRYTGPITLNSTTTLRARVFDASGISGPVTGGQYSRLAADLATRKSNLPMVILDARGQALNDQTRVAASFLLFDRDINGTSDLTRVPDIATRQGFRLRGSSSQSQPKRPFSVEFWDENDQNRNIEVLGMTAESDWVLYAPYNFDRNFTRNSIVYELSRQMGRWAPDTRFVEVFYNSTGDDVSEADYAGVYAIIEQIKLNPKRIGFSTIEPSDVPPAGPIDPTAQGPWTGGYLWKIDRADPDEYRWQTNGGVPNFVSGTNNAIVLNRPKLRNLDGGPYLSSGAADAGSRQVAYLKTYVQTFEDALYSDRSAAFSGRNHLNYIDRASWVDHLILVAFAKNVDALRLSAFFHKPEDSKLIAGPVWDFDRSLNSRDGRDDAYNTWFGTGDSTRYFEYDWWGALCEDPDFQQAFYDRWAELRNTVFSNANLTAVINGFANEIDNSANGNGSAAQRDAAKWSANTPRSNSYAVETEDLRSWSVSRAQWTDRRRLDAGLLPIVPTITLDGDIVTISGGSSIYYTTNGTDPRGSGGTVAGLTYTVPFPLDGATNIIARRRTSGVWSTPVVISPAPPTEPPAFLPLGDGDWTTNTNWTSAPAPYPDGAGVAVRIDAPAAANRAVTLRAPVTIGEIIFPMSATSFRNRLQADGPSSPLTFSGLGSPARIEVSGTGTGIVEFQNAAGTILNSTLELDVTHVAGDPLLGALRLREAWTGPGGLRKTGVGMVSLTGADKTYSGPTSVDQGVLVVTQPAAMVNSNSITVTDGGQLRLSSTGSSAKPSAYVFGGDLFLAGLGRGLEIPESQSQGKLGALRYDPGTGTNFAAVANAIELTALADLHVDGASNTLRLTGALRGDGPLRKTGGGTLEITATNASFAAPIDGQNGTLRIRGGIGSDITLTAAATLDIVGEVGPLAGGGQLQVPAAAVFTPSLDALQRTMTFGKLGDPDLTDANATGNSLIVTAAPGTPLGQVFYIDLPEAITGATIVRGGYLVPASAATAPLLAPAPLVYVPSTEGTHEFGGRTWALEPTARVTAVPSTLTGTGGRILELRFDNQPLTFDEWRTANFAEPDSDDPAISGPAAMPFSDGVPNLIRYALGVPAGELAANYMPTLTLGEDSTATFQFPYDPGLRGLRWIVEATDDLTDWSTAQTLFDSETDLLQPDENGNLVVTTPVTETRQFFRLKVSSDANR